MTKKETKIYKGFLKALDGELSKPIQYDNATVNQAQRPILLAPNRVKQLCDALANFTQAANQKRHTNNIAQYRFDEDVPY